jgi:hypothetical protein
MNFQGASAVVHTRKHGEELLESQGPYRVVPYPRDDPSVGFRNIGSENIRRPVEFQDDMLGEDRMPLITNRTYSHQPVAQWPWGGTKSRSRSPSVEDDGSEGGGDLSEKSDDEPLFLRRDIPSIVDAPEIHQVLLDLWEARQEASIRFVQALNTDDQKEFVKLESLMRNLNQKIHQVLNTYRDLGAAAFVDVDDLPLPQSATQVTPINKSLDLGSITINLDYKGNQIVRTVRADTPNLDIHHMAIQYLMGVFNHPVESFADLHFSYDQETVPYRGSIEDFPMVDGGTVVIRDNTRGSPTQRQQGSVSVFSPGLEGSPRGNRQEESRPLNSARAPSQPVNNGGAYLGGSQRGYQQGESHSLKSARASSRPGNNGEALDLDGSLCGNLQEESHSLKNVRAPSRPGNNGGAYAPVGATSAASAQSLGSGSNDKLRQAFKCSRFSGQAREWKQWNKGFMRYLSIWDLEYVLDPDFLLDMPLSPAKLRDNKLVFFIIEDAVQSSPMAAT